MKILQQHQHNLESTLCDILQEISDIDPKDRTDLERRLYDNIMPMFRHEDVGDKISNIHIETMVWRDKTYGNSYHGSLVSVLRHGEKDWTQAHKVKVPFQYGSEQMQEQTAKEELEKDLKVKIRHLHIWCRERGVVLTTNYNVVRSKKAAEDFAK